MDESRKMVEGREWKDKEFYHLQKWVSEQKKLHGGKTIAYAKIDGNWKVIADGWNDGEVLENLERYKEENGLKDEPLRCHFR